MASALRYRVLDHALGAGIIPDPLLRAGSRHGARARLRGEERGGIAAQEEWLQALVEVMSSGPVAELPDKANEQHYELPAEFLGVLLGPRRKYSCCLWEPGTTTLEQAEDSMLALTCARAGIEDGMRILDLGCGWGSLSLWLAERYPNSHVVGVSNSHRQRAYIEFERDRQKLSNLDIRTADVNDFAPGERFDRVVSIEMFEHMRNWAELLRRIAGWLDPETGKAFVHVFSHRHVAYRYESTWAAERFFTAGTMPSHDLMLRFQDDLAVTRRWAVPGTHYARTLRAWLTRLGANELDALRILSVNRSRRQARTMLGAWRLFLISTAEIWGWRGGSEWMVSHYLLEPRRGGSGKNPDVASTYSR